MQNLKSRFSAADGTVYGSLQSCIRTNDINFIGDSTHLTYFEMLGNFSFAGTPYSVSVDLWTSILMDLGWNVEIHVHPSRDDHKKLWHFPVVNDHECVWSDGEIGGHCCEVYYQGVEIGNLVNPLEHSTDVGFGWERMLMFLENKNRIDETSVFDQSLPPICRDHERTLNCLWINGITPGNKKRNYICRRLLRRLLRYNLDKKFIFQEWLESEKKMLEKSLSKGRKMWHKHSDKPAEWWWNTCGLTKEDIVMLR